MSIFLIGTMIPLFISLNKLSLGKMELTRGVKMLAIVFSLFTFCYITQFVYNMIVDELDVAFMSAFSGFTLPIMWDFMPILLMFSYHFQNLRILKEPNMTRNKSYIISTLSEEDMIRKFSSVNMDFNDEESKDVLMSKLSPEDTTPDLLL